MNPAFVTCFELSKQVYVYKHKLYVVSLLILILKTLLNNLNVIGIDLVEYNPLMDKYNDINTVKEIR